MAIMTIAIGACGRKFPLPSMVTEYAIDHIEKSRAGVCYASATGEPSPNFGEQKLPLETVEGSLQAMTFQVALVAKPHGSKKRCNEMKR